MDPSLWSWSWPRPLLLRSENPKNPKSISKIPKSAALCPTTHNPQPPSSTLPRPSSTFLCKALSSAFPSFSSACRDLLHNHPTARCPEGFSFLLSRHSADFLPIRLSSARIVHLNVTYIVCSVLCPLTGISALSLAFHSFNGKMPSTTMIIIGL